MNKMIEGITGKICDLTQIQTMNNRLKKLLGGRRFLIVLDDVWTTDEHQWRELQLCLDGGKVGSKIVVTARSLEVAHMVRSNIIYPLKGLSQDDCWKLFRSWAFGEGQAQETSMLVERGNDIVRKCGGLPLAVEDLGGLRKRIEDAEWLRVQNTEIWKLSEETMNIIRSLKLSYQHMPFHLKQCFAYCSLFPKGYIFDKEKLISLWISEGFVLSPSEEALEDVGQTCFKSLLWRYFFEDVKERYQNHIETCKMHDVVQDLACSVGRDEFLSIVTDNYSTSQESHSSHRYLSLICHSLTLETLNHIFEANKFRSLILVPKDGHSRCNLKDGAWEVVAKLSLLRVLDLSSTNISELPQAVVSNLQHLRLLNMSNTNIKKLPESIVNFQCLITLILSYCRKLQELPNAMSNMSNLRNLDICGCHKLTRMPHRVGRLSNKLQHLPMFIVSEVEGHTIKELQNMKLIRGRLQIKNLHNVKSKTEAEAANLEAKIGLRQLELDWDGECEDIEGVAESLRPNEYLEELMISGYKGNRFPGWMFLEGNQTRYLCRVRELSIVNCKASTLSSWYEVLPHLTLLETLKISNCEELDCLPDSFLRQQIPSLRTLDISGNENLTSLGGKGQNFPPNLFTSVHILMLGKCKSLVELPEWFGTITCLKSLDLSSCINIDRLQQLQMLNKIYNITLCRVLEERYKNETGTDWNGCLISNHREEIQQGRGEDETEKSTRGGKFSFKLFRKFVLVGCSAGSTVHE